MPEITEEELKELKKMKEDMEELKALGGLAVVLTALHIAGEL